MPLPGKPSIAVLAFANMSGDPEQEYFSDGIADDIITELSRSRSLFVIARNSSFAYRGQSIDVRQIARELGVRYVLEGSVRRSVGRVRVTAQLIEAESGNHIWAERYDRDISEVFAVQDEIAAAVASAIIPAVSDLEQQRALRKPPESLGAWEAYQRGLWHIAKVNATDSGQAREFLQRAIALDASFAPAYSAMATAFLYEGAVFANRSLPEAMGLAKIWARRAVDIEVYDAEAQAIVAWAEVASDDVHDEALDAVSLALSINPNSVRAHAVKGTILVFTGQCSQGRHELLTALRLSPRDPFNVTMLSHIATSYYLERDYLGAFEASRRVVSRFPKYPSAYRWLAASLGQLDRTDEARASLRRAIEISGNFFLHVHTRPPWYRADDHEHMLEGLRKAGWQG